MHGLAHSTNVHAARILALDLGKFTSVLCVYDPATHDHHFQSVQTTPRAVHDLLVAHQTEDPAHTLLVIETCDVAGWVHDLATALGIAVAVANCAHEAWRWTRVKRKTDKDDALKLAKLAVLGQLLALARKLLVTLWAMLRDGTRWREPKGAPGLTPALAVT